MGVCDNHLAQGWRELMVWIDERLHSIESALESRADELNENSRRASRIVEEMESRLGSRLDEWDGRITELTTGGERVVDSCRGVLDELSGQMGEIAKLREETDELRGRCEEVVDAGERMVLNCEGAYNSCVEAVADSRQSVSKLLVLRDELIGVGEDLRRLHDSLVGGELGAGCQCDAIDEEAIDELWGDIGPADGERIDEGMLDDLLDDGEGEVDSAEGHEQRIDEGVLDELLGE